MGRLLKNFSLNTVNQIIIILIPLITTPYLTRSLGADSLGLSTYVLSIATLFYSIGTLGTNLYSRREIAYTVAKKENLKKTYYELFIIRFILTLFTILIYLLFSAKKENNIIYFIFLLTIIGNMMDVSWFFIGMEDMKRLVLRNCVIRIASMIAIFIFIKKPSDIYLYALIKGFGDFFAFFIMVPSVAKELKPYKFEKLNFKIHLVPIIKLFLPQAASIIYVQCDKVMIGNLTNDIATVTIYEKAEVLIKLPVTFVNALSAVTLPRIANMYAGDETTKLYQIMKKISSYTIVLIVPIVVGMGLVSNFFVPLYLGKEYVDASSVMIALMPSVIAISLSSITSIQFLMPLNQTKILTESYSFAAISNVILNYFLIKKYGIIGAAIATDFAEISVFAIQYYYISKNYNSFDMSINLVKRMIALLIMVFVVKGIEFLGVKALLVGLIQIFMGGITYFAVLYWMKDSAVFDVIKIISYGKNKQLKK